MEKLSRRALLRAGFATGLALTGTYGYAAARRLETVNLDVLIPHLDRSVDGFKIGVLSDFHLGSFLSPDEITEAVTTINGHRPDVVALLGDYVNGGGIDPENSRFLFKTLGRLEAVRGVFAVLGNHDYWEDAVRVRSELSRQSIFVLNNENRRVAAGLVLAGVDDYLEGTVDLRRAMAGVGADATVILLSHNPDINQHIADDRIKLVLAGHTHGGQVRLPFVRWAPWIPCSERYHGRGGLIMEGAGRWTFITKGVGTYRLPIRIACPPDVAVLTLRRA